MRKHIAIFSAVLSVLLLITSARQDAVASTSQTYVGRLEPQAALFWPGGWVEDSSAKQGEADACDLPTAVCFEYTFDVVGRADRLRVALSDPSVQEVYRLYLYDPSGTLVGAKTAFWSAEVFATEPEEGTWRALVVAQIAEDSTFSMRAKLEELPSERSAASRPRDLLPNLRVTPPFEFTFSAPLSLLGPGLEVEHAAPVTCSASETATYQPTRCLRFSLGPQNVGDGPLELDYTPASPFAPTPITQVVHRSDGTTWVRDAGEASYHATHAHYHHVGVGTLEVFRVDDVEGGHIELAGTGPKQGYCMAQYLIVDWHGFDQDPATRTSACDERRDTPTEPAVMWLTKGWSDIYGWAIDGNYVDIGRAGDGTYLVRATTDPSNDVMETNEDDNTSYALIEITGDQIDVLERGYGQGPWDPNRVVDDDPRLSETADVRWVPFNDVL